MKIVLRHNLTGRYYNSPGEWVRRSDNALVFDDVSSASDFSRLNHLDGAQPVPRLAPYLMALLRQPNRPVLDCWLRRFSFNGCAVQGTRFFQN